MIDHTGIGVSDVGRSAAFYDAVLGALGLFRLAQIPEGSGADGIGYGPHTAFAAKSRDQVDAFHAAAMRAGGTDNGPPDFRMAASGASSGCPRGCYATFVIDPDGNNIEAVLREGQPVRFTAVTIQGEMPVSAASLRSPGSTWNT